LTLDPEHVTEEHKHELARFYADSLRYAFNMSGKESLSFMLEFLSMLMTNFIEIPGIMTFPLAAGLSVQCFNSRWKCLHQEEQRGNPVVFLLLGVYPMVFKALKRR
jgi:hypothetical protein